MEFKKNEGAGATNYLSIINEDFYISYNKNPAPLLGNNGEETALRTPKGFYIVEKDLRRELEKAKNLNEIIDIFSGNETGFWSNLNKEDILTFKN